MPNRQGSTNYRDIVRILDDITIDLVQWQSLDDGGWSAVKPPSGEIQVSDVWTTSEVIHWLLKYDPERYSDAIDRGVKYLADLQHIEGNVHGKEDADGGWGWRLDSKSESTATCLALLALLTYAKTNRGAGIYAKNIKRGRDWLIDHVNPDGGFSLLPNTPSMAFNTCWGCVALKECMEQSGFEDPRIPAAVFQGALNLVEATWQPGGWGSILTQAPETSGTSYCTYLLLTMERGEKAAFGLRTLRNSQLDDGSWEAGPARWIVEACAWATIALLEGGTDPKSPRTETAIRYLRSLYLAHSGWPERPGGSYQIWTTYYACLALLEYVDALREMELPADRLRRSRSGKKVFIVHGHDMSARAETEKLLRSVGLQPIILEDQANLGLSTMLEKFEHYADQDGVDYAVVLCTPDDVISDGASTLTSKGPRRNVIFELGWFAAKLGRDRVCVISDGDISLPSDLAGIAYTNLQDGTWQDKVKRELREAHLL